MKILYTILFIFISGTIFSQYQIGMRTITYNDPTRTGGTGSGGGPGRQIECAVYYPASTAGTNVAVADGSFPVVVFGHGFAMQWSAYQNIWEHLTPRGYILVFPKTESGLIPAPSHNDFGLDLVVASNRMLLENSSASSPFFQKINGKSGLMGHSMGGGATMLAAENNDNIKTIIGLAPAETNPSAIAVTSNITIPALILSGSSDGVTAPSEHHLPIFNGISSLCKSYVSITGGAHCYFANTNVACDFGEGSASTGITITRAQQQSFMNSLITPWLDFYLKGDCAGFTNFQTASQAAGLVTNQICNYSPLSYELEITQPTAGQNDGSVLVLISGGQFPVDLIWFDGSNNPELTNLGEGNYGFTISDAFCSISGSVTLGSSSLNNESFSSIVVAPNPTNGLVKLTGLEKRNCHLQLTDATGRTIVSQHLTQLDSYEIDVNSCANGLFLLELTDGLNTVYRQKIVKN